MKNYKHRRGVNLSNFVLLIIILIKLFMTPLHLTVEANGTTIYVPDDFPTIQDAINNANSGDTIIVRSGSIYIGAIEIDKELTLQGEDRDTTIIDGMGGLDGVTIWVADNVQISGFTITNCSDDGIILYSDNATITDLRINNCGTGISLSTSNNSTLNNCIIHDCSAYGISCWSSNNMTINGFEIYDVEQDSLEIGLSEAVLVQNCELHDNRRAVYVVSSIDVKLSICDIFDQTGTEAILIKQSDDITVYDCEISNNSCTNGIAVEYCNLINLEENRMHHNQGRGGYIDYSDMINVTGCQIHSNGGTGVACYGSNLVRFDECKFYNHTSSSGLYLGGSDRCILENSQFDGNINGFYVYRSDNVILCNISSRNNDDNGLYFYGAYNVYISGSSIEDNVNNGLEIQRSVVVSINSNYSENSYGINTLSSELLCRYCSFTDNLALGIESDNVVNASYCWWGNATGPYNWLENPSGTGDQISDHVMFSPWQTVLYQPDALISNLRCKLSQLGWVIIYPSSEESKPLGRGSASVTDWLAAAYIHTRLTNSSEGLDTNPIIVNQTSGIPLAPEETGIVSFGGPGVNVPLYYYEVNKIAPVIYVGVPGARGGGEPWSQWYLSNGTAIPEAALGNDDHNDLFLIECFEDNQSHDVFIAYGIGWKGTYAAGKYFDKNISSLHDYPFGWVIVKWEDTNMDGFVNAPGDGDTYIVLAEG